MFQSVMTLAPITISCAGNTTRTLSLAPSQLATISTRFTVAYATVTIGSSNGWDTNFDDLVYDLGQ